MSAGDRKRLQCAGRRMQGTERSNGNILFSFPVVLTFIVCVISSGCFSVASAGERRITFYNDGGRTTCSFSVELAITPEEHERGLMFREKLPDNGGMLFLYNDDDIRYFWMKNTFIPLDMIFLNSKRKVVGVFHAARPRDATTINSPHPARYVLEVNAGKARQCGIKAGMQARFFNMAR